MRYREEFNQLALVINDHLRVCFKCDLLLTRYEEALQNPKSLRLNVLRQRSTETCMICNRLNNDLHRFSIQAHVNIYLDRNIYVPQATRICLQHLDEAVFLSKNFYDGLQYLNRPIILSGREVRRFFTLFRESALKSRKSSLDPGTLTDENYVYLTSLSKAKFNDLYEYFVPVPEDNNFRQVSTKSLFIFLCQMRHGIADEILKILFNYSSR